MRKICSLLALALGMAFLSGCGTGTAVAVYHDPDVVEESARGEMLDEIQEEGGTGSGESGQEQEETIQDDTATETDRMNMIDSVQKQIPDVDDEGLSTENLRNPEDIQDVETEADETDSQGNRVLGIPILSEWEKTYDTAEVEAPLGDGVTFTITWDGIIGADGYEVEVTTKGEMQETEYIRTQIVTEPTYSESFSHINMCMKVRVRAYKDTDMMKGYGEWSQEKELIYSP